MEDRLWGDPLGPAWRSGQTNGNGSRSAGQVGHDARLDARPDVTSPMHLKQSPAETGARGGPLRRAIRTALDYLPRGNTLDAESFRRRHLLMCWILGLHIPALFAFGVWQGYGVSHSALEIATPSACLVLARLARNRRLAAFFVTAGLVFCSSVLVHLSGGTIEAHFHFFILIGLIALYQDWVPFLWNVMFTVLSHGLGSSIAADLMFNHDAAQNRPWSWSVIHGVAVLAACAGVIIFWKNTEIEQHRSSRLATELAESEIAAAHAQAAQRRSISELFVNLARRNQSLLDRQLALISELEQHESTPEALADLFQLDHLATRIRRNAESLLVLSGDEPPRLWGRPVPLAEVVRAAAAEVEDYPRVEVLVNDYLEVAGRVVADLSHLLAELIENATMFSPPTSDVRVRTHLVPSDRPTFVLSIEDIGIGMSDEQLRAANELLADPPEVDPRRSTLGFHVVGRLAQRLGLTVRLAHTPGGGITALVTLPEDVVSERRLPAPEVTPPAPAASALAATPTSLAFDRPVRMAHDHTLARRSLAPQPAAVAAPAMPAAPTYAPPEPIPAAATDSSVTVDGLIRRVPGASLAPSLRKAPGPDTTGPDATDPAAAGGTTPHDWGGGEQTGSMLSRFQAAQRAGRAAAAAEPDPTEDGP
ncbi:MAG TPA: ATP-binding protein [Acidimicrobiales bacterium]|jgi:signal transduction histidine kinase|nr:ATP-binding protein [Acidimicrobiales bacterium]